MAMPNSTLTIKTPRKVTLQMIQAFRCPNRQSFNGSVIYITNDWSATKTIAANTVLGTRSKHQVKQINVNVTVATPTMLAKGVFPPDCDRMAVLVKLPVQAYPLNMDPPTEANPRANIS